MSSAHVGRSGLLFPEENEPAELGIEGVPEWFGDKGEVDGEKDVDKVESEGTMRVWTAEVHMNA
jgi:hypothetical protein